MGVDLPMPWPDHLTRAVVPLNEDTEIDPQMATMKELPRLSGISAGQTTSDTDGDSVIETIPTAPGSQTEASSLTDRPARSIITMAVWTVLGLLFLAAVGSVVVMRKT